MAPWSGVCLFQLQEEDSPGFVLLGQQNQPRVRRTLSKVPAAALQRSAFAIKPSEHPTPYTFLPFLLPRAPPSPAPLVSLLCFLWVPPQCHLFQVLRLPGAGSSALSYGSRNSSLSESVGCLRLMATSAPGSALWRKK